jgi:predicted  nucleic acid-binding Zn-ribbon protein
VSDSYDIGRLSAQVFAHQREIIALREELKEWKREVEALERNAETTYENHKRIVAELTAERDEARRMYCKCHAQAEAIGYAEGRGWDCFKEDGK